MAVVIRMTRMGRHKKPFYRLVVADSAAPRDGRFIEILGTYDPLGPENKISVKADRAIHWLKRGARVSDTVRSIFKKLHLFQQASVQNVS